MFDKIEQILQKLGMMRPSPIREELTKIATAMQINQKLRHENAEKLKILFSQMNSDNEEILQWAQEVKDVIDEYARLVRELRHLRRRAGEVRERL